MLAWLWKMSKMLRDERGIETLEWILIGALITGVGFAVYNAALGTSLTSTLKAVTDKIATAPAS